MPEEGLRAPRRVQLSRQKGWRLPANTVKVDRTTRWGNPFRIGDPRPGAGQSGMIQTAQQAVDLFRLHCGAAGSHEISQEDLAELRGRNLACWCRLDQPCHADVLLERANVPPDDDT